MPNLRRQILNPSDLGEIASSRGGHANGEAWMRTRRRLRAELSEEGIAGRLALGRLYFSRLK
jgi:hypothetical protein